MKIALYIFLLSSLSFAEYQKGKIDMHGGKENYKYEKRSNFSNATFGISLFADTNATKSKKPIQK